MYENGMEKGYAPDWALLNREQPAYEVLGAEFETLCLEFMVPLWELILSCPEEA